MDTVVVVSLLAAFGTLVTVHLLLAARLLLGSPRWRGLAVLLAPPLAPVFAFQSGMRVEGVVWTVAALVYLTALLAAQF